MEVPLLNGLSGEFGVMMATNHNNYHLALMESDSDCMSGTPYE